MAAAEIRRCRSSPRMSALEAPAAFAHQTMPTTHWAVMWMHFLVLAAILGCATRGAEAQFCERFLERTEDAPPKEMLGFRSEPSKHFSLELRDCRLEGRLPEPHLPPADQGSYITHMRMYNVTLAASISWDDVLRVPLNGDVVLDECHFEDGVVLETLNVSHVLELKIVNSGGLRSLPRFLATSECAMRKANLSRNALEVVSEVAFRSLFANCKSLADFDLTHNAIRYFPQVKERGQHMVKCRLYIEHNPLSCYDNDHLVLSQRTREMLPHTPHCEFSGKLVQFWFHDIKLCRLCSCSIRFDVYVDCSQRHLKFLPESLPRETSHLNVSGNELTSLQTPDGAQGYQTLKYLDASWNKLVRVDDYEPHICNLVMLDLSHNRLKNFPKAVVDGLVDILHCRPLLTMGRILLSHNPWVCDCELRHFKRFIGVKAREIVDFSSVRCHEQGEPVWSVDETQLCPPPLYQLNLWDVAMLTMLILITTIISKTVTDHYRQKQTGKLPRFFKF